MVRFPRRAALLAAILVFGAGLLGGCTDAPTTAVVAEAPAVAAQEAPPAAQPVAQPSTEVDAARAYAHVQKLSVDIGPRVAGTAEERAAADYLAATLRSYGYEVDLQPFPVEAFVSRGASLKTTVPSSRTIAAQPFDRSHGGAVQGEVVFAGLGRPADFPPETPGRIALIQRGEIEFATKARNAAAAGAAAVVIYNSNDDGFGGALRNPPTIPVLAISGADGRALRNDLRAGPVRADLRFDGGVLRSESVNVIARSPGQPCRVVVGGHYDSVAGSPGASDNATGTAAMVELARVSAAQGNPTSACFVAFASEETGLDGSKVFVRNLSAGDRQALRFMINFDMVAVGSEWIAIGSPRLQQQAGVIAEGMGIRVPASTLLGASSDHASFIEAGIPALMLHRVNDPLLHTPEDVIARVSLEALAEAVRLGLAFLEGISPS
jgi:aminopeptidase YwaD